MKGYPRQPDHPPAITKAVDIECGHTWIAWHEITKAVWTAIVFIDADLCTWKWFKFAKYDGNQVVAKLIGPQGFRIYGGPGHTSEMYHRLKVAVGNRIETLEFIAVAQFLDLLFVFTVWSESQLRHHSTICVVLKEDVGKFGQFASSGFKEVVGITEGYYVTGAVLRLLGNGRVNSYYQTSGKSPIEYPGEVGLESEEYHLVEVPKFVCWGPMSEGFHQLVQDQ
ncbi:hypothetical protein Cantr_09349 [Candida viswanathii]|uniref:Uncharacterized protein n=1 Tax=Candida viswanathii TaxID=5486 RepID=A0A367YA65_9ASCO|nr:hypothetical protein Cantr_09349 [Candida viswanathii]